MRVLLFRSLCDTGGVSSWMQEHARELLRHGAEPHFWFETESPRLTEFQQLGPTTLGSITKLLQTLESDPYDVVHVSTVDPSAEFIGLARPRVRIVASNHGALSDAWNSRNCHARTAVSADMARLDQPLTDLLVEAVPNGIDGTRFSPPPRPTGGPPIIGWAGRTTDVLHKDFPRFTRIAARRLGGGARVWVADAHGADWGQFTCPPCTRVDIDRWERVPHEAMPEFYRAVAASGGVMVITSPTEGFGLIAAEAAACGAAVIAPDVLGLRQTVISGVTGALFPASASDQEVADLVELWLDAARSDPGAMYRRADAAREAFSPQRMTRTYLDIYQRPTPLLAPRPLPEIDRSEPGVDFMHTHMGQLRQRRGRVFVRLVGECLDAGLTDIAARALRRAATHFPEQLLHRLNRRAAGRSALRIAVRSVRGPRR